jgi:rare lipoprotein A
LGFAEQGVARVRVRYLGPVGGPPDTFRLAEVETPKEVAEGVAASPTVSVDDQALEGAPVTQRQPSQSERRGASSREDLWVQVGAFLDESNANRLVRNLSGQLADPVEVQVARVGEALYHRVRVGPWDRVAEADAALDNVLALGHPGARIVVD